jgi:uncharacterized protein
MDTKFQVPTIDIRVRISAEVIDEIAHQIAQRFKPQKIILFGSYANGTSKAESDIDLLVIMDTTIKEIQQAQLIRQYLNPLFGIDLVVHTPANLSRRLELGDLFLQEVVSKGRVLYESTNS